RLGPRRARAPVGTAPRLRQRRARAAGAALMAAVALLRPAVQRQQTTSPLTPEQALELTLLAITMTQPLTLDRATGLLQRIAAPLLQPTVDAIEARRRDLTQRGLLVIAPGQPGLVRRTAGGRRHLRRLLRTPAPPRGATHHDLVFMLKACLL